MSEEKSEFRKRFLLKIFSDPMVLIPFAIGCTFISGAWALGGGTIGILAGLASLLGSAGIFISKFVLFGEKYAKDVLHDIEEKTAQNREKELDFLRSNLYSCQESMKLPNLLSDLQSTCKEILDGPLKDNENSSLYIDISQNIKELFDGCIDRFNEIVELSRNIDEIKSKKTKTPMIERRDQIVLEVEDCVSNVATTLVEFRKLKVGKNNSSQNHSESLVKISQDLARTLEVAKRVEERKNSELSGIDIREYQN
jgi:hypothetical protein